MNTHTQDRESNVRKQATAMAARASTLCTLTPRCAPPASTHIRAKHSFAVPHHTQIKTKQRNSAIQRHGERRQQSLHRRNKKRGGPNALWVEGGGVLHLGGLPEHVLVEGPREVNREGVSVEHCQPDNAPCKLEVREVIGIDRRVWVRLVRRLVRRRREQPCNTAQCRLLARACN